MKFIKNWRIFLLISICLFGWIISTGVIYGDSLITGYKQETETFCVYACIQTFLHDQRLQQCEYATAYAKKFLYKRDYIDCCNIPLLPPHGDFSPNDQQKELLAWAAACSTGVLSTDFDAFLSDYDPVVMKGWLKDCEIRGDLKDIFPAYGIFSYGHCVALCGMKIENDVYNIYYSLYYFDPYYGKCFVKNFMKYNAACPDIFVMSRLNKN